MKPQEWRQKLGDCVRDLFLSPEMQHFYSIEMTRERAQIYLLQLGIYVRQRRNFWPQVAANCPEFEVKQRIMEHEHEELVEDEHSKAGHLDLIFRQGRELGLVKRPDARRTRWRNRVPRPVRARLRAATQSPHRPGAVPVAALHWRLDRRPALLHLLRGHAALARPVGPDRR